MKRIINSAEKMLGGLFLLVIICLAFIQIVSRKLGHPLAWSEEYALICLVWFGYLGASACALEGKHLRVEVLLNLLPRKASLVLNLAMNILWLVVNSLIGWAAFKFTAHAFMRNSATIVTKTPYWIVIVAVPVGFLLMSFRVVQRSYLLIQAVRRGTVPEEGE